MITHIQAERALHPAMVKVAGLYSGASKMQAGKTTCIGDGVGNETFLCTQHFTGPMWKPGANVRVILGRIRGRHHPQARLFEDFSGTIMMQLFQPNRHKIYWTVDPYYGDA